MEMILYGYLTVGFVFALAIYFAEDEKAIVETFKNLVVIALITLTYPIFIPYRIYQAREYNKKQKGKIPRSAKSRPQNHSSDEI